MAISASLFAVLLAAADAFLVHHSDPSAEDVEEDKAAGKFIAFIQQHGRTYEVGSEEYQMRLDLFKESLAAVEAQNQLPGRSWNAGINKFADHTPAELAKLRGYRRGGPQAETMSALGLASIERHTVDLSRMPANFTWQGKLKAMDDVQSQGACGSCWAVSSATALQAFSELYQTERTFSAQQLVDCAPNPQECGGTGGCKGATAELAFDYVAKNGLVTAENYTYVGRDGTCPEQMKPTESAYNATANISTVSVPGGRGSELGMTGWHTLPHNRAEPLLAALYEKGPAVIAVAATEAWYRYRDGIFNDCLQNEMVINHAVVLVGYGQEGDVGFWQIQNSWGSGWGEEGFIRIPRLAAAAENEFCGWDKKPQDGIECKGGPSEVWVCGHCGVIYSAAIPLFASSPDGWMAANRPSTSFSGPSLMSLRR